MRREGRRTITYDIHDDCPAPVRGDYLVSIRKDGGIGTRYLVLRARQVKRHDPKASPRWVLNLRIVEKCTRQSTVHPLFWNPRKKRTFEDYLQRAVRP